MGTIRRCGSHEQPRMAQIINEAAQVYRGAIPPHCWHEPYMPDSQLQSEILAGVEFWGYEEQGRLVGIMGIQPVRDVELIRHAYVVSGQQRSGVGAALIQHLRALSCRQMLVGTWAAATWAIRFYQRHGFALADRAQTQALLTTYWDIPPAQAAASVVLRLRYEA